MMKNMILVGLAFGMIACVDGEATRPTTETEVSLPLTSRAELDAYLRREPATSPLRLLSPLSRQRFVDGLVFGEHGGVASFFYGDMQVELSDGDARAILRLFDTDASWDWISPPHGVVKPEPPLALPSPEETRRLPAMRVVFDGERSTEPGSANTCRKCIFSSARLTVAAIV